jgi:hypothetical protein
LIAYDPHQVLNMFSLMLDPRFKFLLVWKIMWDGGMLSILLLNMMQK